MQGQHLVIGGLQTWSPGQGLRGRQHPGFGQLASDSRIFVVALEPDLFALAEAIGRALILFNPSRGWHLANSLHQH